MLSHTKQSPNITRYISISSQRTISDSNTFTYNTRNMRVCWCMSSVKGISILHMPRDIMYLSQAIKATHRHRSHFHHQTTTTTAATVPTCLSLCKQNKMYTYTYTWLWCWAGLHPSHIPRRLHCVSVCVCEI